MCHDYVTANTRIPLSAYSDTMKQKLGILDYLHRGVVYSCVGLSIYAITMTILVHRDTMKKGEGACKCMFVQ